MSARPTAGLAEIAAASELGRPEWGRSQRGKLLPEPLGASEEEAFWLDFLRSLVRRGLKGVRLVTSDAHEGLRAALGQILNSVTWRRCRVHYMRNILAHVPKGDKAIVAAALRTILAQPDRQAAGQQLVEMVGVVRARWPKAAELLAKAEEDVLAYMAFPGEHWSRIYSTSPLERLNKEIKRRTYVVGVFPDQASAIRLVGSVLMEIADDWQVNLRYSGQEAMKKLLDPEPLLVSEPAPFRLALVH